jgi:hypothetical protein
MASCSDIPGRICPSEGLGRLSTARLMSSGVMFIQSGIPFKNCAMGPDWTVSLSKVFSSRNILVHVITLIVKVQFAIFIAVNRRWTRNTGSCFGTKNYILASTSDTISAGTILRALKKDALCVFYTLDIVSRGRRERAHLS